MHSFSEKYCGFKKQKSNIFKIVIISQAEMYENYNSLMITNYLFQNLACIYTSFLNTSCNIKRIPNDTHILIPVMYEYVIFSFI